MSRDSLPSRVGDLLPQAVAQLGPAGLWTESRLRKAWPELVGELVAANARIIRLRAGRLEVAVASDSWATELRYLTTVLVSKLNAAVGQHAVREVVVRKDRGTAHGSGSAR